MGARRSTATSTSLWQYIDNTSPAPAGFVLKNRGTGQCARSNPSTASPAPWSVQLGMTACPASSSAAANAVTWQRPTGAVACFP